MRRLLWGVLAVFAGPALAQVTPVFAQAGPPLPSPLTGNEILHVLPLQQNGQLGAFEASITLRQLSQFVSNSTVSTVATGAVTATTPTLMFTAALTGAVTVTPPATPTDGEVFVLVNSTAANFTQTITVAGVATNGVVANLPAGGSARFRYTAATMMWTRI